MIVTFVLMGILGLFGAGLYAALISRNLIKIIVAIQILIKSTLLAMLISGQVAGKAAIGESMALTIIVADTVVAVVGLALAVQVRRHFGTLDVKALSSLRR